MAATHALPPTHLYPSIHPVVLRAVQDTEHALPLAQGKPPHDWFLTVEQAPAPLQYWVVRVPAEQVDKLHDTEVSGYVHAALEPLQ